MKYAFRIILALIALIFVISSCEDTTPTNDNNIVYKSIDKEFVLIRDVHTLQQSDDEISNYVDSILSGLISAEFVSTGQQKFDLNDDSQFDIGFEIIDLYEFNPNGIPESFDSLAVRVFPISVEVLDNSTFGYPDALISYDIISENGNWNGNTCVLGTFMNAGQFQGNSEKFLGFRFINSSDYKYGWLKIYCSQHNDTLRIFDFAYNNIANSQIMAGQME